jgi:hypothetical protein
MSAKDVMILFPQKSQSASYRHLDRTKKELGKKPHQLLTLDEYCYWWGISEVRARKILRL